MPQDQVIDVEGGEKEDEKKVDVQENTGEDQQAPKKEDVVLEDNLDIKSETGSVRSSISESASRLLVWTLNDVFGFNPKYLKTLRGILNVIEIVVSMLAMSLIASACEIRPFPGGASVGFSCRSSDNFAFVIACSSFLFSMLFFICCILSRRTERRMHATSFELCYYMLFFFMFFLTSLVVIIDVTNRNAGKVYKEVNYEKTLVGGIFSAANCLFYGVSAVWFYFTHRQDETN